MAVERRAPLVDEPAETSSAEQLDPPRDVRGQDDKDDRATKRLQRMRDLLNTSDNLWQELQSELKKAGTPGSPGLPKESQEPRRRRSYGRKLVSFARETWVEALLLVVLVGCAFVKPYLAVLLATLKVFLEITILAASYLRKRPGERILPLLLFVANRVLAVCIPVIGIIYLSGSAISASKLLSAEEWSIVGLLAFHLLVTLVRLPRIAEWFVTAWPRTASSKSDVQELLGLEADSAGHPAGGWHQFQTVDREMIKRRLRTSPHTNFVVECAGHGIVKSVYARNVSCDDIERWLASDTHFTAKELNHDGMFGAPDAPAHGDDALFVIGLQGKPGYRHTMDLALLFTMQHLAANEQKTAFIGVRLPEFRASQKGLHEYVMSGMDPMLGHVMSDLYVSRWASVVKGLAGYWIDGPSRNSAALVRLDNPVYGKGLFHRLMFLGKLEWLMVHYGFSAYPPETLDSNGLNV